MLINKAVFVLGLLTGAIGTALAQKTVPSSMPFSRANIVLVQTPVAPDAILAGLVQQLTNRGFLIDSLDKTRGLVTTKVVVPAQHPAEQTKIRAVHIDGGWKLTGLFTMEGPLRGSATAFPAQFLGLKDAPAKTAFREVEEVARTIPQGILSYDRGKISFGAFTPLGDALKSVW